LAAILQFLKGKEEIMNTQLRIFWLVALLFFTAGCSGFQPACFTGEEGINEYDMSMLEDCHLQAGERVKITTTLGTEEVGDIQRITDEWIVLAPTSDLESPRLYTPSQILIIQKSKIPHSGPKTVESLEIGDEVALNLKDGTRVKGEILSVSDETIVLDHEREPNQSLEFPRGEIESVELPSSGTSWVGPVVFLVTGTLIVGGIVAANSWSDMNGGL
jgi:hypothetical protein